MNVILILSLVLGILLIVFVAAYFCIRLFLQHEQKKGLLTLKQGAKDAVIPLRLQAYERLAILLERVDINALLPRLNGDGLTVGQLHTLLIKTIRAEYEHNLSQQIFVSPRLWELIIQVKEDTLKRVHVASAHLDADADSMQLATTLIEQVAAHAPNATAMKWLKEEVSMLF
ncbi:MAG: hypothetical protein LBR51_04825 [Bacteroidales bacterium]|jgi:hypothetical protein|nr:hypothetical protein [Bacteroidales bacterium]